MISVKNLEKTFHTSRGDLPVLMGISQTIEKGEKVVIVGPSGSGKSTFLRCLNLLERPTSGEIWFEDEEITNPKCNINLLRQKMGMVFQHFNFVPAPDNYGKHHAGPDIFEIKDQGGGRAFGHAASRTGRSGR